MNGEEDIVSSNGTKLERHTGIVDVNVSDVVRERSEHATTQYGTVRRVQASSIAASEKFVK